RVSVSDAVQAATAAVSDMSQFCKRQPQACEVGGQAATVIGARAEEGARKIYQSITEKKAADGEKKPAEGDRKATDGERKLPVERKAPDRTGSIGEPDPTDPALAPTSPQDTLTAQDLSLDWRLR